ncbi:hypothetical protein H5410_022794 [Solanum commersonii]|uniref:DUF4283 domain-containing protein n=1 Tax=Solanum commersonii TaxID=4109 RepID=A0A9J5ZF17_SOLCO|nr:hypothetical protein H5410_022794 [Solanum commersonii]
MIWRFISILTKTREKRSSYYTTRVCIKYGYKRSFFTDKPVMADPKSYMPILAKAISITDGNTGQEKGLLARCIVRRLNTDLKELPTLSDIRKWVVNTWKKSFGVNIYEMGDAPFYLNSQTGT